MCVTDMSKSGVPPEVLKARMKDLAERHWKLLDAVLKAAQPPKK